MSQEPLKLDWIGRLVGGHYEVVEKLASGSHSQVFWGRNLMKGGVDAAIKVAGASDLDPFASDRLHHEGTVLFALAGAPACPRLLGRHFSADGEFALVIELLDGMSLQSMLERGDQRLDLKEVVSLFGPVITTLSALHALGIIHRNIHPGKIFRSWDPPGLKLLGLGDALFTKGEFSASTERFCSLPKYASPEVWSGAVDLDQRADVYSLAVVLFRCLAGRCPFEVESSVEFLGVAPRALRPSLVELAPSLPAAMEDWATIALCPDREGRFDNVEAMWRAFLRASQDTAPAEHLDLERLQTA